MQVTAHRGLLIMVAIGLIAAVVWRISGRRADGATTEGAPLLLYCAAGVREPVQAIAKDYQAAYGVAVDLQFGGSGTLLSNLEVAKRGDLYLSADAGHLQLAVQRGLVAETIPVAIQSLVIVVPKGNPKQVRGLSDLIRSDLRVAYANPEVASAGKTIRTVLTAAGIWEQASAQAAVFKPTVNDVANDVNLGSVDAGVVWDALTPLYPALDVVTTPELSAQIEQIGVGVLRGSAQPTRALHFARYLTAADRGLRVFHDKGYRVDAGDAWAERPELVLYSGAVNRLAIHDTVAAFEQREGCTVTAIYNGCGILLAQLKAAQGQPTFPDAFLACDVSFLDPVREQFGERTLLSETEIIILAASGNPQGLHGLADLGRPGLRLGIANPAQSTLGALTMKLLREAALEDAVIANVRTQTPTADMLVNQLQSGALDAVVVYRANATRVQDRCAIIPTGVARSTAVQPFAVAREARHPQLAQRLLRALRSPESQQRYLAAGFVWRGP